MSSVLFSSQCGLACHRKCLASLAIKCGSKRLPRKMNTFGVDFSKHLKSTKRLIPIIVSVCIAELDLRGLHTRGLYRVSSAKSKLEHLCQLFETGGDRVDLNDRPAHLIGSCLKLYFRQVSSSVTLYRKSGWGFETYLLFFLSVATSMALIFLQ